MEKDKEQKEAPPSHCVENGAFPEYRTSSLPKVLIVDDEPMLLEMLSVVLSPHYHVMVASSGKEVVRLLKAGASFDAIICDLNLPCMSGAELYALVARETPGQEKRMIFITGGGYGETTKQFLREVPNPRLEKPFDLDALLALIASHVGAHPP